MAVTKADWVKQLRRAAGDFESEYQTATSNGHWHSAYENKLTALIWRAAAVAIDHDLIDHRLNLGAGALGLARVFLTKVVAVADDLEPSRDETSQFRKAQIVSDLLAALLDGVGVIESWTGGDLREAPFVALRGFELGRAESALSLVESGHWEQVAEWSRRQGGRPEGYRQPWRTAIAPDLQAWIDADPAASNKTLMVRMWDWLEAYAEHEKSFAMPEFESLRAALRAMHKQGLIRHPRWD